MPINAAPSAASSQQRVLDFGIRRVLLGVSFHVVGEARLSALGPENAADY